MLLFERERERELQRLKNELFFVRSSNFKHLITVSHYKVWFRVIKWPAATRLYRVVIKLPSYDVTNIKRDAIKNTANARDIIL
jgi:hypothetical protein